MMKFNQIFGKNIHKM